MSKLEGRDYIIVVDKSGSMSNLGTSGRTRWQEAQETTGALARKANEFDPDGISVIVFAGKNRVYENVTPDKVAQIFIENEPSGSTNLAGALTAAFGLKKDKPITLIILTDGQPDSQEAVEKVIVDFTKTCADNGEGDTDDAGILFLQVGDDSSATTFLEGLDDGLLGAKFDIVDTKTCSQLEDMTLTEALLEALEG
jgi:Mg-chelatase subunit ChlD